MRAFTTAFVLIAATAAFAEPPPTPVVVGREDLQRRLLRANQVLSEAIGRLQKKNQDVAESLKTVRAELDTIREQLAAAPVAGDRDRDGHRDRDRRDREVVVIHKTEVPPPPPPPPGPPPGQPTVYPMTEGALQGLTSAIAAESFARDRLRVLEQAAPSNWFLVGQVQQLLTQFDFSKDRLTAARILKPRILDTENYFRLYGSFTFPSEKAELKKILAQ